MIRYPFVKVSLFLRKLMKVNLISYQFSQSKFDLILICEIQIRHIPICYGNPSDIQLVKVNLLLYQFVMVKLDATCITILKVYSRICYKMPIYKATFDPVRIYAGKLEPISIYEANFDHVHVYRGNLRPIAICEELFDPVIFIKVSLNIYQFVQAQGLSYRLLQRKDSSYKVL